MNWFYQKKKRFLIRLLRALGFGSVIAYSICGCEQRSRPTKYMAEEPEMNHETTSEMKDYNSAQIRDNTTVQIPNASQSATETDANAQNAKVTAPTNNDQESKAEQDTNADSHVTN